MKKATKIWIAAAAVSALGALTVAGVGVAAEDHGGWHRAANFGGGFHHGRQGGPGEGRHPMKLLRSLDADEDGRVTQAEIDQGRASRHAAFDANGDQTLTLEEFETLWLEAMREHMVDRFQSLDDDGDAAVTLEEFQAPFAGAVTAMDRNGDGALGAGDMGRHGMGRHGMGWHEESDDDD